ncbi:hypothetical protein RUND412_003371 [Rhizina undulata]
MDLTSLSSNLPRNHPASSEEPPETDQENASALLLSVFKQAALSVTNLYKAAATERERSYRKERTEGYQECLDDILVFIEKVEGRSDPRTMEMLRQWALSRRRKAGGGGSRKSRPRTEDRDMSSDVEEAPTDRHRSVSPLHQRHSPPPNITNVSPSRKVSPISHVETNPVFSFRSDVNMPRHVPPPPRFDSIEDVELPDNDDYAQSPPTSPTIHPHAHGNHFQGRNSQTNNNGAGGMRLNSGSPSSNSLNKHGAARAGTKRRLGSLGDFFDLAGMEKIQFGNKRSRHQ